MCGPGDSGDEASGRALGFPEAEATQTVAPTETSCWTESHGRKVSLSDHERATINICLPQFPKLYSRMLTASPSGVVVRIR